MKKTRTSDQARKPGKLEIARSRVEPLILQRPVPKPEPLPDDPSTEEDDTVTDTGLGDIILE